MANAGGRADLEQADQAQRAAQPEGCSSEVRANRRAFPRHSVDCPVTVIPVAGIGQMTGQISDLSMGGCLVRLPQGYFAEVLVRVEIQFQLRGIAFRIPGVTVGRRGAHSFAIRFLDVPMRRQEELAEVLNEVAAANAAKAETPVQDKNVLASCQELVEPQNFEATRELVALNAENISRVFESTDASPGAQATAATAPARQSKGIDAPHDRRAHGRHTVDTSAKLLLVKSAIPMTGRIVNLSMGGCRIRTDEPFNVGIFVRVETEFYLHGLPFRIAGVSQAIQDRKTIGIRFLDMSERCRAQLAELIAEIEEAHAIEDDAPAKAQCASSESLVVE